MTLAIEFLNDHFCAVYKPAGWLSVPSRFEASDPRPVCGVTLQAQLKRQIWPCHRLDEDVSGLLLFALTAPAHKAANGWFEKHTIQKTYQALSSTADAVQGKLETWKCRLMRGKRRSYEADFGKESITQAVYRGPITTPVANKAVGLWELQPLTGRPHQLRYEMMRHQLPIIGDTLYGSQDAFKEDGIALRAVDLNFLACTNRDVFQLPTRLTLPPSKLLGNLG